MNQQIEKLEVEEAVIKEIRLRRDIGRAKYGNTMERTDLTPTQWCKHAKEELLDGAIYLQKLEQTIKDLQTQIEELTGYRESSATKASRIDHLNLVIENHVLVANTLRCKLLVQSEELTHLTVANRHAKARITFLETQLKVIRDATGFEPDSSE